MYDMRPTLYVMCGLSGSGKTSTAKKIAKSNNAVIVSSDEIREEITGTVEDQSKNNEVFQIFHKRIKDNLVSGKSVIADATNLTMKSRRRILSPLQGMDIRKICVITPKKYDDCLEDNKNREYSVPEEVIKKQMYKFQVPFREEGFEHIEVYTDKRKFSDKTDCIIKMMNGFDQKNPHHSLSLGEHCVESYFLLRNHLSGIFKNYLVQGARFHDVGKLFTQTFDGNGITHYYNHENVGSYFLLSYNADCFGIVDTCFLVNYHMLPFQWNTEKTRNKYRRIFGKYKYELLMDFHKCNLAAK